MLRTTKPSSVFTTVVVVGEVFDVDGLLVLFFVFLFPVRDAAGEGVDSMYPRKESGAQSKPSSNEREKFSVARAERNRPRRTREKDLMRRNCWLVGLRRRVRMLAMMGGTKTFAAARICAVGDRSCDVIN